MTVDAFAPYLSFARCGGFCRVWNTHIVRVEQEVVPACVTQNRVVLPWEVSFRSGGAPAAISPHDLVPKVPRPEDRVHQHLQVRARRRIAVQVDRTRVLEHPPTLDQPDRHHQQVAGHPAPVHSLRRAHDVGRLVVALGELAQPDHVHVVPGPRVLEERARRLAPHRRRVVPLAVERRVQVDQVHAFAVDAPENGQIVAGVDRAVLDVAVHLASGAAHRPSSRRMARSISRARSWEHGGPGRRSSTRPAVALGAMPGPWVAPPGHGQRPHRVLRPDWDRYGAHRATVLFKSSARFKSITRASAVVSGVARSTMRRSRAVASNAGYQPSACLRAVSLVGR